MSNTNVETVNSTVDRIKLGLAVLVVIAGIVAFSLLEGESTLVRVGAFIGSLVVAFVIVWFSETGRRTVGYMRDSYHEVKRVVWPSRKEATQMTGIVFVFVTVMAIILWIFDKALEWIIYGLFLGWN
ncbi:preprotein translocase subunit SecE [Paracandidimonas soli]|uniref:Protein translocase subunit SecE n=1 Tax=Paracandidimonas soli TaxID=1917182 RepID=A0A4R3UJX4_9BURK|nr:preprotein translocase subunit SecE [Paracandidimonas soli]TCU91945.1 preprotein translocase subunit SecE [Paracandidimonas soli]